MSHGAGEFAHPGCDHGDECWAGGDPEAGFQDRPAPDVGEEDDRSEEHRRERDTEYEHRDVAPSEVDDAEQVEVQDRCLARPLIHDEHAE